MYSKRKTGRALRTAVRGPSYEGAKNGRVHTVDSSAILDADTLHVFATNRSLTDDAPLRVVLADRAIAEVVDCEAVTGDDPKAENSFEDPSRIRSEKFEEVRVSGGAVEARLPPMSVVAMSFSLS
jgi:alpha-N-arabinofuranosidase